MSHKLLLEFMVSASIELDWFFYIHDKAGRSHRQKPRTVFFLFRLHSIGTQLLRTYGTVVVIGQMPLYRRSFLGTFCTHAKLKSLWLVWRNLINTILCGIRILSLVKDQRSCWRGSIAPRVNINGHFVAYFILNQKLLLFMKAYSPSHLTDGSFQLLQVPLVFEWFCLWLFPVGVSFPGCLITGLLSAKDQITKPFNLNDAREERSFYRFFLHLTLPKPPALLSQYTFLTENRSNVEVSILNCRVRDFTGQHPLFIQTLMDFHWSSCSQPTTRQPVRAGEWEGSFREMDGTSHLLGVQQSQGDLLNLVEEERLSDLMDHLTDLPFLSKGTNGACEGFRERLSHWEFWHRSCHCLENNSSFSSSLYHRLALNCISSLYVHLSAFSFS